MHNDACNEIFESTLYSKEYHLSKILNSQRSAINTHSPPPLLIKHSEFLHKKTSRNIKTQHPSSYTTKETYSFPPPSQNTRENEKILTQKARLSSRQKLDRRLRYGGKSCGIHPPRISSFMILKFPESARRRDSGSRL